MTCPVCKGESFSLWAKAGPYTIETCVACGLGITSPFPSAGAIAGTNEEIYTVENRIKAYLSRVDDFKKRYRRYLSNIKRFQEGGKLLDIGCNIGLFLTVAREEGFSVAGVELNRACADYARNTFGLEVFSDVVEKVGFASHGFDVVTLFDVLEHVPDIETFLSEVRRILKPGGLLVVQSPNLHSLMASLTKGEWVWLSPPDHIYHFTPSTLSRLLEANGFAVRKLRTWEPAKEFADNVIVARVAHPFLRRLLLAANDLTRAPALPLAVLRRIRRGSRSGALVEVYAARTP
ncbi:MAG: class I SAM-dependent methyltransferase [Deltaproteobacteria bacterium]|nr:class I SAM-dependent methyltransferase [Deltaproteobacteria bacterium]